MQPRVMPPVTTRTGDNGATSLGAHGFVGKTDERIALLGELDDLRSFLFTLPDKPAWLERLVTELMVAIVSSDGFDHEAHLERLDFTMSALRGCVTFPDNGWFMPRTDAAFRWDRFRVMVRTAERTAWRVWEQEGKERHKDVGQLLNRLSDYAFLHALALDTCGTGADRTSAEGTRHGTGDIHDND